MSAKMTPLQMVIGYGLFMAAILGMTAISWLYPDKPNWVSWVEVLAVVATSMLLIYLLRRSSRKNNPPA